MPVTAVDVADWLDVVLDGTESALMERIVSAVSAVIIAHHDVQPGDIFDQAVLMQSGRLWKRRHTPEGISTFGPDFAIRVNRIDPDIDALLSPYRAWGSA